jgi:CARDB protein
MKTLFAGLLVLLCVSVVPCSAATQVQQPDRQGEITPQTAVGALLEKAVGLPGTQSIASPTDCTSPYRPALTFGVPGSAFLGDSVSCFTSGIYIDFWPFNASAGQQVTVTFSSTPAIFSTIQIFSTGTVVANSRDQGGCGTYSHSCSFNYTVPSTDQYIVGIAGQSTGNYTVTVSSGGAPPPSGQSNLTPCTPSGWSAPIVIGTTTGGTTDASVLRTTDTLYVDYAVCNLGTASTGVGFSNQLFLDGVLIRTGTLSTPLDVNHFAGANDFAVSPLSAGTHTLRVVADSTNAVSESNEADNQYTKPFTVVGASSVCTTDSATLCLNANRFRVSVAWVTLSGRTGDEQAAAASGNGQAVSLTGDTGYFWFFSANNVELVIKVVDGRAFNNFFWVFYGALSNVQYTITVTDTLTGTVKVYNNPQGNLASVADTAAFH